MIDPEMADKTSLVLVIGSKVQVLCVLCRHQFENYKELPSWPCMLGIGFTQDTSTF
jgi:hypothetical protein